MGSAKNWKSTERALAKRLGGERVPVSGRTRGSSPDIAHLTLAIEVKERQQLPAWLHAAVNQARKIAKKRISLLKLVADDGTEIAVLTLKDWERLQEYVGN
jgi:hypothetical protein